MLLPLAIYYRHPGPRLWRAPAPGPAGAALRAHGRGPAPAPRGVAIGHRRRRAVRHRVGGARRGPGAARRRQRNRLRLAVRVEHLSGQKVVFDDVLLEIASPETAVIVQEEHRRRAVYYGFGLGMAGLDYNAPGNQEHRYTYNGKEKQDQFGLGWLDYGARHYQADIGRWGGVDALAMKHYNHTPFAYCADNPILYADFDGNDYGVTVDRCDLRMTISAHYISSTRNSNALNTYGRDRWNAQSGAYVFITGSIKDLKRGQAIAYSVHINLTTEIDDGAVIFGQSAGDRRVRDDPSGTLNSYDHTEGKLRSGDQLGGAANDEVTMRDDAKMSGATTHEVSHTLGNAHTDEQGSLSPTGGYTVRKENIAEALKGVGIGGDTRARNAGGPTGDGRMLNGSTNQGLETGKLISQRRYDRIMRRMEEKRERQNEREQQNH
jgi:RHS repeat-associated protein